MNGTIVVDVAGEYGTLTINRNERRNSLDNDAIEEFLKALEEIRRSSVVALCITGAGDRAFCAGSDLKALAAYTPEDAEHHTFLYQKLTEVLDELPCATIAAIEGACLGGGLEIALACDYRIASENARFGFPEITVGALPTGGGTVRAPRAIGLARSRELMIFGEAISATEALSIGLVSKVVPPGVAIMQAQERAKTLAGKTNREAVKLLKAMLVSGAGLPARAGQMMAYLSDVALVRSNAFMKGAGAISKSKSN